MSDADEERQVKGEDAQVKEDKEKGMESDVEILAEENTAKEYFEFELPTRGWAQDTANRVCLPNSAKYTLSTQPLKPACIQRNWMPQLRITIKADGSCFIHVDGTCSMWQ